jgi:hypothetical protein
MLLSPHLHGVENFLRQSNGYGRIAASSRSSRPPELMRPALRAMVDILHEVLGRG